MITAKTNITIFPDGLVGVYVEYHEHMAGIPSGSYLLNAEDSKKVVELMQEILRRTPKY